MSGALRIVIFAHFEDVDHVWTEEMYSIYGLRTAEQVECVRSR